MHFLQVPLVFMISWICGNRNGFLGTILFRFLKSNIHRALLVLVFYRMFANLAIKYILMLLQNYP